MILNLEIDASLKKIILRVCIIVFFTKYHFFSGYDYNNGIDYHKLLETYRYSGFQATSFGCAVEEIKKMVYTCIFHCLFIDFFSVSNFRSNLPFLE